MQLESMSTQQAVLTTNDGRTITVTEGQDVVVSPADWTAPVVEAPEEAPVEESPAEDPAPEEETETVSDPAPEVDPEEPAS